jgi:hypothetical protein
MRPRVRHHECAGTGGVTVCRPRPGVADAAEEGGVASGGEQCRASPRPVGRSSSPEFGEGCRRRSTRNAGPVRTGPALVIGRAATPRSTAAPLGVVDLDLLLADVAADGLLVGDGLLADPDGSTGTASVSTTGRSACSVTSCSSSEITGPSEAFPRLVSVISSVQGMQSRRDGLGRGSSVHRVSLGGAEVVVRGKGWGRLQGTVAGLPHRFVASAGLCPVTAQRDRIARVG